MRRHRIAIALLAGVLLALSGIGLDSAAAYGWFSRSRLAVSLSPDRTQPVNLHGAKVSGRIYVFACDAGDLKRVEFYLDDPWRKGAPVRVEHQWPFDFAGTAADGRAIPFDTTKLRDGRHSIKALLYWHNGRTSGRRGTFVVDNTVTKPAPAPMPTLAPSASRSATPTKEPTATQEPLPTPTKEPSPSPTASPTTSTPPTKGGWPSAPPAKVCGNASILNGPASAPAGAIVVPAGDNRSVDFRRAGVTYWFAPGVHTLGSGEYDQIQPGDGSTFVGAPGAIIDGQGRNKYAFTQHGRNVTIKHLTIRNFAAPMNEGTVNHDSGVNWTMQYNTVTNNGGAGIFLGAGNVASYNCLKGNSQYGFQGYSGAGGASGLVLDHNEITGNNTGDWETKIAGCGCTGGGKFWDVRNVRVTNNWVHGNESVGLWADTNDNNFLFEGNWIEGNDREAIFWETSYNVAIRNNVIKDNNRRSGPARLASGDNFPDAAIYISPSRVATSGCRTT
jgi:hypothetical protein